MLKICNSNVIDPVSGDIFPADVFVDGGRIVSVGGAPVGFEKAEVLDASGLYLAPGLVDMHVHLREPGFEYKEDIHSGALAALYGGVTTVAAMPNTKPVTDNAETLSYVMEKAKTAAVHVLPTAAVTVGQRSEKLCYLEALAKAGAVAFTDDGRPVSDRELMREALIRAGKLGLPVLSHCETAATTDGRAVNEGRVSKALGLPGRPAEAEEEMVLRDCLLAEETGGRVHIDHVSTAKSVDIIRKAKARGVRVTAETCPQYFSLTEDAVLSLGAFAKVNPPLRTSEDVKGMIAGLVDGTLDVIVTDHAPHSAEEKAKGLVAAPAGMVGLETSLALTLTKLYHTGCLGLVDIIRKLSLVPARILGAPAGTLEPGVPADLVLFDPEELWTVRAEAFHSKARNTAFEGETLKGRVKYTVVSGKVTKVS